jgi:acyl dehydratase
VTDTASAAETIDVGGPWFDELSVGQVSPPVPALTLTDGHAALHQAIVGDRLALALDGPLSAAVTGSEHQFAHPALVWDVAIGQSTLLTQRVIGNLFYRGLVLRRAPAIGDTLRTSTEVVALRQNSSKPGRAATGMAVLRVRTTDQHDRRVLDFWRCAMLPLSEPDGQTGHADSLDAIPSELDQATLGEAIAGWRLDRLRDPGDGDGDGSGDGSGADAAGAGGLPAPGTVWRLLGGDVVSAAPELARMTLNVAVAHHDARGAGRRLVYGGHTIGIAAAHVTRVLPNLVTFVAWHGCDHTGPVLEGDTLSSEIELERVQPLPGDQGGQLVHLRCRVSATRGDPADTVGVLDWRPVGVIA